MIENTSRGNSDFLYYLFYNVRRFPELNEYKKKQKAHEKDLQCK